MVDTYGRIDPSEASPRILIANGSEPGRKELRALLSSGGDWLICGEASTGPQAVKLSLQLRPDVVVLDLALPELNGLEATRQIKASLAATEVLACMSHEADDLTRAVLRAGALGCLLNSEVAGHLSAAVDALCRHRPYLTPAATRAVLNAFLEHAPRKKSEPRPFTVLTPREREVLQLLAEGHDNGTIAGMLTISVKTVETHRAAIMKKVGLGSLAELARYAIRNRVIDGATS